LPSSGILPGLHHEAGQASALAKLVPERIDLSTPERQSLGARAHVGGSGDRPPERHERAAAPVVRRGHSVIRIPRATTELGSSSTSSTLADGETSTP
jgi:hypothetical protein